MGRNSYLRQAVACACGWRGLRAGLDKPCPKCGGQITAYGGLGGRTFDQGMDMAKGKARTFGQGLMRGEHVVGGGAAPAGLTFGEVKMDGPPATGTSIFDPVLCELAYRWFCPPGGLVLDPFAGGSVRGIVASKLGRRYFGCELRAEQVEANRDQADRICDDPLPIWHHGDSREIVAHAATHVGGVEADFMFSCPPYADLEVYSEDPADLSTMAYADFREAYFLIVAEAAKLLRPDSFACFVVGEVRGKNGNYYGFVPDTIEAFRRAGLAFYHEGILVTSAGSLPIRAGKQFEASRKLGKTHQNVLVFVKGDAKRATAAVGPVEFGPMEEEDEHPEDGRLVVTHE
jgi:hypothetical protein